MNPQSLQIFCQVMTDESFSAAARSLRLSQPTVSQHIARLEEDLGTRLFQRVGHEVVPTAEARRLRDFSTSFLEQLSDFRESFAQERTQPQGLVRYAMPESCQWTPHYRRMMGQIAVLPGIQFQIGILPSEAIVEGLLEGKFDFGFIVGEKLTPDLRFEKFSEERYSAVARARSFFDAPQRMVSYPGSELFYSTWAKAFGLKQRPAEAVRIGTLAGAIHAVQEGAGMAVIPTHCVAAELASGELVEWKKKDLRPFNPVYLARRTGEKAPRRVEIAIEMLRGAKLSET